MGAIMCRISVFVATAAIAMSAHSEQVKWLYDASKGASPLSPALFADSSNWKDAQGNNRVPATGDLIDLSAATNRYIRLDDDMTFLRFYGVENNRPVIMGSGSLTFTGVAAQTQESGRIGRDVTFFVPVKTLNTQNNAWTRFAYNNMAADLNVQGNGFQTAYGPLDLRMDWYANDSSPTRSTNFFNNGTVNIHYDSILFYAPQSSPTNMTSRWTLTQGSAFAVAADTVSHALPVGTLVASEGFLPAGAYLKRIYPDGTIEFSAAALDSGEVNVEFAAFTPCVRQRIAKLGRSVKNSQTSIIANKWREEDELRITIADIMATTTTYPAVFSCSSGFYPGTFVLEDATRDKAYVNVFNGRIEFAGKDAEGTGAGVPNGYLAMGYARESATLKYRGYVVVTNGITATVVSLTNIWGTLVKDGAGTLVVGLPKNATSCLEGKVEVREGVFSIANATDGLLQVLPNVVVSNGASLKLPSTGLKITGSAVFGEGSSVVGPGILAVPDDYDLSLVPADETVLLVHASQLEFDAAATGYSWDEIPPVDSLLDASLPVPASWMDASLPSSLVTSNGDTQVCLLKWKDVRGDDYPYAYPASATKFAQVVTNTAGEPHHVYIAPVSSTTSSETRALRYSPSITKVKAVFKVWNGNGHLICSSASLKWMRPDSSYAQALFYNDGKYDGVGGKFYVNGALRPQKTGHPYGAEAATDKSRFDPEVAEFHFSGTDLPSADYIGYYGGGSGSSRNGRDRICEMLLYTNDLTFVQRQKICAYLMKKWMHGAEANREYGVDSVGVVDQTAEISYPVASGKGSVVHSATGSVSFVKTGEGTMFLEDLANTSGCLRVSGGTLKLNSANLSRAALPGCPYLHLDASDTNTMTFAAGSTTKVSSWSDVRGDGHITVSVVNADKCPTLTENALNGMSVVNYPRDYELTDRTKTTGFAVPETDRLYSVFKVLGGAYGGGVIAGYAGLADSPVAWNRGGEIHTFNKTLGGWSSEYVWFTANTSYAIGQGLTLRPNPGGTDFRINGVDCDPTTTKHIPNEVNVMAYNGYDHAWTDVIGFSAGERGILKYDGEACYHGEVLFYTNTLSRASALKVEAYLNKKWCGVETPGYRPAATGRLAVDEGATLEVYGGAPVSASAFACAGTVSGAVALTDGATLELVVEDDGTVSPLNVSGGIDFSRGGTVSMVGGKLKTGVYPIAANAGASLGEWTVTGLPRGRDAVLVDAGGVVSLAVFGGSVIIVR